jgi:alpha-amylase
MQTNLSSYTSDYSQAKNVISFMFFSDGIPIVYAGQEQHYSGGADPANREAVWLSGYSTSATLYSWIASTNKIRKLAISKDSAYITSKVFLIAPLHSTLTPLE